MYVGTYTYAVLTHTVPCIPTAMYSYNEKETHPFTKNMQGLWPLARLWIYVYVYKCMPYMVGGGNIYVRSVCLCKHSLSYIGREREYFEHLKNWLTHKLGGASSPMGAIWLFTYGWPYLVGGGSEYRLVWLAYIAVRVEKMGHFELHLKNWLPQTPGVLACLWMAMCVFTYGWLCW